MSTASRNQIQRRLRAAARDGDATEIAGLLDRHREGSWVFYRLTERGAAAELARTLVDSVPAQDPVFALDMERLEEIRRARAALWEWEAQLAETEVTDKPDPKPER